MEGRGGAESREGAAGGTTGGYSGCLWGAGLRGTGDQVTSAFKSSATIQFHFYMGLYYFDTNNKRLFKKESWDFPGGTVVKNPPASAGDTGSSPG